MLNVWMTLIVGGRWKQEGKLDLILLGLHIVSKKPFMLAFQRKYDVKHITSSFVAREMLTIFADDPKNKLEESSGESKAKNFMLRLLKCKQRG